jgi:hypothetical protein
MKRTKRLIPAAVGAGMLFLFPLLLYAQPSVKVDRSTYEFDPVPEGTQIEHSYVIKNTGDIPLHIQKVNTG